MVGINFKLRISGGLKNPAPEEANSTEPDNCRHDAPRKVGFLELFKYSSRRDLLLMLLGSILAIFTGFGYPLLAVIVGDITQSFLKATLIINFYNFDLWQLVNFFIQYFDRLPKDSNRTIIDYLNMTFEEIIKYSMEDFHRDLVGSCYHYVFLAIMMFVAGSIQVSCFVTAAERRVHQMRKLFFRSVLRQDIEWFDRNPAGKLATVLFDNLEKVRDGSGDKLALLIQYTSQLIAGFCIALYYDWRLTGIMLSLAPLLFLCGLFMAQVSSKLSLAEAKHAQAAAGIAEEALSNIRTVTAFNGQKFETNRYANSLQAGSRLGAIRGVLVGAGAGVVWFCTFAVFCLSFWVATNLVADRQVEPGSVLTCFISVLMGSIALSYGSPNLTLVAQAQAAAGAVYAVLENEPNQAPNKGYKPSRILGKLSFRDLRFAYPSRRDVKVLDGVSFECTLGETVALVGPSGSGKSTIAQLLLKYYEPNQGQILIDGENIAYWNGAGLRDMVGVVSQEPVLFNTTIEENIRFGRSNVNDAEVVAAYRMANATNFISALPQGLKTMVGDRGTQLSGGQKQRIAIARALIRNPRILILDESTQILDFWATSALDSESETLVQTALDRATAGRTTIVIAHRLSTIRNADKIVAMKDGRVEEIGTHDELMSKRGLYYQLATAADQGEPHPGASRKREASPNVRRYFHSRRGSAAFSGSERRSSLLEIFEVKPEKEQPDEFAEQEGKEVVEKENTEIANDLTRLAEELAEEDVEPCSGLNRLWSVVRSEWHLLGGSLLFASLQGIAYPSCTIFFTQIIELFADPDPVKTRREGHFYSVLLGLLGIYMMVAVYAQHHFCTLLGEKLCFRLRLDVFKSLLSQAVSFFDEPRYSAGRLTTRLARDVPTVKGAVDHRLGSVFTALVSIVTAVIVAFVYGWHMALLVVGLYPLAGLGHALQLRFEEKDKNDMVKRMEDAGRIALEAIESIRTVRALNLETRICELFEGKLELPHRFAIRSAVFQGLAFGFANAIPYSIYAATFRFGLYLVEQNLTMPMDVMRIQFAVSLTAGSIGVASAYFPELARARLASALVFALIDRPSEIHPEQNPQNNPELKGRIELREVAFKYPSRQEQPILKGLDLEVEPGQTVALVGASGCGKSTIVQLMQRFYEPLSGKIKLDDWNLHDICPSELRRQICMVQQEPVLFNGNIKENILYGLEPNDVTFQKIQTAIRDANLEGFVEKLPRGLETNVGGRGTQLSGGQKQRIAIARALVRDPKIILLDEATSALDLESEKAVQKGLEAACHGRTVLVIAHRLETIRKSDKIAVISEGRVAEIGTHQELLTKNGIYAGLYKKQCL